MHVMHKMAQKKSNWQNRNTLDIEKIYCTKYSDALKPNFTTRTLGHPKNSSCTFLQSSGTKFYSLCHV